MKVDTNAETVEVEYETTRGSETRLKGEVEEIHTKDAMFGDGQKVQAVDFTVPSGELYRVQHTGAVRHQNDSGFRTVGYKGEVSN